MLGLVLCHALDELETRLVILRAMPCLKVTINHWILKPAYVGIRYVLYGETSKSDKVSFQKQVIKSNVSLRSYEVTVPNQRLR